MGAPVAASAATVKAALGVGGEEAARRMLRAVAGQDRVEAERAARGLKKVAEARGDALYALRKELFQQAMQTQDLRVRWNLVIVLGKLPLKARERAAVMDWLFERLRDESSLTRTFALQALWNLSAGESAQDRQTRGRVMEVVRRFAETGTAAMRARAMRLLKAARSQA